MATASYHAGEWTSWLSSSSHASCWVVAGEGGLMVLHSRLILLHCWVVTRQQSIMTERLSDERSNSMLALTTEAIQHCGQRTPSAVHSHPLSLHREVETTPESFLTSQLCMSSGTSLNLCDSIFHHREAIVIPTLSSSIWCKIEMRSWVRKCVVKYRTFYQTPAAVTLPVPTFNSLYCLSRSLRTSTQPAIIR